MFETIVYVMSRAVYETVADEAPRPRRKDPLFVSSADQRGLDDSLRPSLDSKKLIIIILKYFQLKVL